MPLIACPECGRPVSNQAPQCPSCGFPLQPGRLPQRHPGLTCGLRHLEELADLKATWAEERNATNGTVIAEADQAQLLKNRIAQLWCPKDAQRSFRTSYVLNPAGVDPICLCDDSHSLEATDEEE